MGAERGVTLSREAVIAFIHGHLNELTDDDLEEIIDLWMHPRLYDARISAERTDNDILKNL